MPLILHNLKSPPGAKKKRKRVGRGNASGHGTYSGRGLKGQRSRSGGKKGLKRRGLRQLLRNKPKFSGFKSLKPKMEIINIKELEKNFKTGDIINSEKLIEKRLIRVPQRGLKILGEGKLNKKFTVIADAFSESAKEAIIKAGGQIQIKGQKQKTKKK